MSSSWYRIGVLIPALVFSAMLFLVIFLTFERIREGKLELVHSIAETAHIQMTQLQDILSDNLLRGDLEQAKQRLSQAALSPQIATLILADADHTVLIANRQEWVATNAANIPHYDRGAAERASARQQGDLQVSEQHHIHGYFPVTLGVSTGEIRPQRSGTLFVGYDFTDRFNLLRDAAYKSALRMGMILLFFALALSLLLHILIARPIIALMATAKEFAAGNPDVRIKVSGINELSRLSTAFNEMATELMKNQEDLHLQNIQLEEEVAERQLAQEALQDQAVQLEAEVSERQMAQEALEEQSQRLEEEIAERRQVEEKLKIIFDTAQAGIIMVDADGVITFSNRHVSRLYGLEPAEVMGSRYLDHVHEDERAVSGELLQRLVTGDLEAISTERHYLRRDGTDFWGFINAKRHLDYNGSLISAIFVITDITELKKGEKERQLLQQKFNQSQKMEAIGRLAGGVAHDFNNKLTVIMGFAELMKMQTDKRDEAEIGRLDEILKAANHSQEITRQLLAFSRSEVISPHKVYLNSIIEDSRKSLGRLIGEDIRLEFKLDNGLWPTLLDPTQIDQIIMNLAVNARDAMPDGGLLEIETLNVHIDESYTLKVPNIQPGDFVQLSVSDNGSGMGRTILEHIFEPFFTTKAAGKGTGLGLATIYGIVSQNNGFINVYSEVGLGTTFKIYFPRWLPQNGELAVPDEITAAIRGNGTILLVEDEDALRKLATELLSQLGYTVYSASLPQEALELSSTEELKHIDMILTDVIMPGMNGKEMCDRIMENRPAIPVLYMSGYAADVISAKGILENSVNFIQKPFNLQKLSVMVREVMGKSAAHGLTANTAKNPVP